jgi:hypothetical protein
VANLTFLFRKMAKKSLKFFKNHFLKNIRQPCEDSPPKEKNIGREHFTFSGS